MLVPFFHKHMGHDIMMRSFSKILIGGLAHDLNKKPIDLVWELATADDTAFETKSCCDL